MKRVTLPQRSDLEQHKLLYDFAVYDPDYWVDDVYYALSLKQVENDLEAPGDNLLQMIVEEVHQIVTDEEKLQRLKLPEILWEPIRTSWQNGDRNLLGRFDVCYSGKGPFKLLEFNSEAPIGAFETGVFQWERMERRRSDKEIPSDASQFNLLHDKLIESIKQLGIVNFVHLIGFIDNADERGHLQYLAHLFSQAGCETFIDDISSIGITDVGFFTDRMNREIETCFRLYPATWMATDEYAKFLATSTTRWIEPLWTAIPQSKAFMALLWERHKNHPNLLPTFISDEGHSFSGKEWVVKPISGSEGQNVQMLNKMGSVDVESEGVYEDIPTVHQQTNRLPVFETEKGPMHTLFGLWTVGPNTCAASIRESVSPITDYMARFVPHYFVD